MRAREVSDSHSCVPAPCRLVWTYGGSIPVRIPSRTVLRISFLARCGTIGNAALRGGRLCTVYGILGAVTTTAAGGVGTSTGRRCAVRSVSFRSASWVLWYCFASTRGLNWLAALLEKRGSKIGYAMQKQALCRRVGIHETSSEQEANKAAGVIVEIYQETSTSWWGSAFLEGAA